MLALTDPHEWAEPNVQAGLRATPGLVAAVLPSGHLELYSPLTNSGYRCGPTGTVMWILLQRHNWQPRSAAEELAVHWDTDSSDILSDVEEWVSIFRIAGLLTGDVDQKREFPHN